MFNRLNIMQKTILGFGAVLLLMVISGAVAWNGISGCLERLRSFSKSDG